MNKIPVVVVIQNGKPTMTHDELCKHLYQMGAFERLDRTQREELQW